jgi:D-glycero-alpha-D-manno-heptose-7-phosphate kinase
VACTKAFVQALRVKDWISAAHAMNREVEIRKEMTPEVLDELGDALVASAVAEGAGARFTGAGEGGCIWALGETPVIERLRTKWSGALSTRHDARFLSTRIAPVGLEIA